MFKFCLGFVAGVYVAQNYPKDIPSIDTIAKHLLHDLKSKLESYEKPKDDNKPK